MAIEQIVTAASELPRMGGFRGAIGTAVDARFPVDALDAPYAVSIEQNDVLDPGSRWTLGYRLVGDPCFDGAIVESNCIPNLGTGVPDQPFLNTAAGVPFEIHSSVKCSTFGLDPETAYSEFRERAVRSMLACQWSRVAYRLWTGQNTVGVPNAATQYLAGPGSTNLTPIAGPANVVEAIATLEEAASKCSCGQIVIHVPMKLVSYLAKESLIVAMGDTLWTYGGTQIIADPGYDGSGPGGVPATANDLWIYATSRITARLGEVRVNESDLWDAVAIGTNDVRVSAYRDAMVGWLCCHYSIQVTIC